MLLAAGAIVVAACGSTPEDPPEAGATATTTTTTTTAQQSAEVGADPTGDVGADEPIGGEPAAEPSIAPPDEPTSEPADEAVGEPADEAGGEPEAMPAGIVWPDDGCSADNSPAPTDSAAAPAPKLQVRPESDGNALPDLAVRRINCNGGWVNLKNELPSEQPLLVWFWAPH